MMILKLLLFFVFLLNITDGLIVRLPFNSDPLTKTLAVPVQVPRIPQDPQNLPQEKNRYFNFEAGGILEVDLQVTPILKRSSFQPNVFQTIEQQSKGSKTSLLSKAFEYPFALNENVPPTLYDNFEEANSNQLQLLSTKINHNAFFCGIKQGLSFMALTMHTFGGGIADLLLKDRGRGLPYPYTKIPFALSRPPDISTYKRLLNTIISFCQEKGIIKKHKQSLSSSLRLLQDDNKDNLKGFYTAVDPKRSLNLSDTNQTYLMLLTSNQWIDLITALMEHVSTSVFEKKSILVLQGGTFNSYLKSALRVPIPVGGAKFSYTVTTPGNYVLLFVNPSSNPVRLSGVISMVNNGRNHLSAQDIFEAPALLAMLSLNVATSVFLCLSLLTIWSESKTDLHSLMTLNFLIKSLYLLLDWYNCKLFEIFGELPTVNWVLPRMIAKVQDIVALMLFLLLALGWKVHRYRLSLLEIRFCAGVCVLSFYLGVFEVSMGGFQASRYILHSLAYLCVIVAINFNIALLGNSLTDMGLGRTTAETYRKAEGYTLFRIIFIIFILKPTMLLFYKLTILFENDDNDWILLVLDNLLDWGITMSLVYVFRPFKNFKLFEDLRIEGPNTSSTITEEPTTILQTERDIFEREGSSEVPPTLNSTITRENEDSS